MKSLEGAATDTVNWASSVGNERGVIVMSVLTTSESAASLKMMANGLVQRYRDARKTPSLHRLRLLLSGWLLKVPL